MRELLLLMFVILCAFNIQAQYTQQEEDRQIAFTRARIGIDYSMPDFSTKRIDGAIIGEHLAEMLDYLQSNYSGGSCNSKLTSIVRAQNDFVFPPHIKKFIIREITKVGDEITVNSKITLGKNSEGINELDIPFVFDKGVSQSSLVNALFIYLSIVIGDLSFKKYN